MPPYIRAAADLVGKRMWAVSSVVGGVGYHARMMTDSSLFPEPVSVAAAIRQAAAHLSGDEARREAELLLEQVLDVNRAWLFMHPEAMLDEDAAQRFAGAIARRMKGEPLAYITGRAGFWTLELQVTPDTLIPRPETELLVELALQYLPIDRPTKVADLGTGSGAIALALASERPLATVMACDISAAALVVAQNNAQRHGLTVQFREGSWFSPLANEVFHLIVSNPPYIAQTDPHLSQGGLPFEPYSALASGRDGLDDIAHLARHASPHLYPGGWLLVEHGFDQGAAVCALFEKAGFVEVRTERDLEGRNRVTLGRKAV